jgi:2-dehydro-3-deoxygalactonokinase
MGEQTGLIGVDWGLSQLRAYRIGGDGRLLESRSRDAGIASVQARAFDTVLGAVLADWHDRERSVPILLCGMIGSRQGWKEAPYASCPLDLAALGKCVVPVENSLGDVRIIGGAKIKNAHGRYDVMRGEETQMFGLVNKDERRMVITPGTHSKWSSMEGGAIRSFRTYMTGELYALLKKHSILGRAIPQSASEEIEDEPFQDGVRDALADPDLPHGVFNARTLALFEPEQAGTIASYLSGLLLGYEICGASRGGITDPIVIIGASRLAKLYKVALALAGFHEVELADANIVTARGLWRIWQAERNLA